jgi:hypothetical protein
MDQTKLQTDKLILEIEDLKRRGSWEDRVGKFIPMIATFVAVGGFFFTLWQAQNNDVLARESQERERISKVQSQIRVDKEQLLEFITSDKISAVRCAFLIDDLSSLLEQLPNTNVENERITDLLSKVVWELNFEEQRHINFDAFTLEKWSALRQRWKSDPEAHHGFLARKYYPRMVQIHQENPKCVETLDYDERRFTFTSADNSKACLEGQFPVLTYGLNEHLKLLKEIGDARLLNRELEEFRKLTNNSPVAQKFSAKYGSQ